MTTPLAMTMMAVMNVPVIKASLAMDSTALVIVHGMANDHKIFNLQSYNIFLEL